MIPLNLMNGEYEYVPGFQGTPFLESSDFHDNMMGRSEAEQDALKEESITFFKQRFGIDVNDPALLGKIAFFNFLFDPRLDYRVHTVSGANVPAEGWKVWDAAWTVMALDPAGVELGGEFEGEYLPVGGLLFYGDYYIPDANPPIHIQYKAAAPIVMDADGEMVINCELSHPEWGNGAAQGASIQKINADGTVHLKTRNVLTFE